MSDQIEIWREQIQQAAAQGQTLEIVGGGTRRFYGRRTQADRSLEAGVWRGIVDYDPAELVVTARAGTPLAELEEVLAGQGQMLAFEPLAFARESTIGGAVATAMAGARRPWTGAVRDYVLGLRCINGHGQVLSFGGRVMKNVAGFDVSRLMCGAMGTLGLILEVSLKLLPLPRWESGYRRRLPLAVALDLIPSAGLPLSGLCHDGEFLYARLAGDRGSAEEKAERHGLEAHQDWQAFWGDLRRHRLGFFTGAKALWRCSRPMWSALDAADPFFCDWAGAQYWLASDSPAEELHARLQADNADGACHAALFRGGERNGDAPLPIHAPMLELHRRIKRAFDPAGVFNPGRMFPNF